MFLAVGQQGQRIVSENGTDWKNQQLGKEGEYYRGAAIGNGRYVAVGTFGGNNILSSSVDGVAWKTINKDGKYKNYVRGLGFGNGIFLAIGGEPVTVGAAASFVMISKDGDAWSDFIPITGKFMIRRIAFGNNLWVGVGDRGRRSASVDGKDWKDAPESKAIDTLVDVTFGNGVFVGVGLHGLRMSSKDGLKWENQQRGEEGIHLNSVVWTGSQFVAAGMGATVCAGKGLTYYSPDGVAWKTQPNADAPQTMCYGKDVFVGINWRGRIMTSVEGAAWKQVYKSEHNYEAVAYGDAGVEL